MTKERTPLPGNTDAIYDCAGDISAKCFPQPEWRSVINANYDLGDFGLNAKIRLMGEVNNGDYDGDDNDDYLVGTGIDAQTYLDLSVRYTVSENVTTRFGINNILDEEPPMTGNTMGAGAFYDQLGRYIHGSVSLTF